MADGAEGLQSEPLKLAKCLSFNLVLSEGNNGS